MTSLTPNPSEIEQQPRQDKPNHKLTNDQIPKAQNQSEITNLFIQKGRMIRVLRGTFIKDEFVVDHEYKGHTLEIARRKEDIVQTNISLLFDYYEKVLGMGDMPQVNMDNFKE